MVTLFTAEVGVMMWILVGSDLLSNGLFLTSSFFRGLRLWSLLQGHLLSIFLWQDTTTMSWKCVTVPLSYFRCNSRCTFCLDCCPAFKAAFEVTKIEQITASRYTHPRKCNILSLVRIFFLESIRVHRGCLPHVALYNCVSNLSRPLWPVTPRCAGTYFRSRRLVRIHLFPLNGI